MDLLHAHRVSPKLLRNKRLNLFAIRTRFTPSVRKFALPQGARGKWAAFTLAEVLITLGIIGIVAAITLPSLIQNYQKKVTSARLKEAYSIINQALQMAIMQHGDIENWDFRDAETILHKYIAPNVKARKYKNKENDHPRLMCFSQGSYTYTFLSGQGAGAPMMDNSPSLELANGSCIGLSRVERATAKNIWLFIDINGSKTLPNVYGKDLFTFLIDIKTAKIIGYGQPNDRDTLLTCTDMGCCNKNANFGGQKCTAVLMYDGWEFKKDYPW